VLADVLAAATTYGPPVCVVPTGAAMLAGRRDGNGTARAAYVLFDEFAMFGLQPPLRPPSRASRYRRRTRQW